MGKVTYRYKIRLTPLGKVFCAIFSAIMLSSIFIAARISSNTNNVQAKNSGVLLSLSNIAVNDSDAKEKILENSKSTSPKPVLTINFNENSSLVNTEYYTELDNLTRILSNLDSAKIIVEGNIPSSSGSEVAEWQKQLSLGRAQVIESYLIEKGIDPSRIILKSNLGYKPIKSNSTSSGRNANDRTDIFIRVDN